VCNGRKWTHHDSLTLLGVKADSLSHGPGEAWDSEFPTSTPGHIPLVSEPCVQLHCEGTEGGEEAVPLESSSSPPLQKNPLSITGEH
jgi:hypothetical protein